MRIKVEGLAELGAAMRSLSSDVQKKIARAATNAGAQAIRKIAVTKAPKDTGNLRKNIIVKRIPPNETNLASQHIVTVRQGRLTDRQKERGLEDAFYAKFVEFGTVKMSAQPFLRPAFDQGKEPAVQAIKQRLKARIDKAKK